jgi:hypothetical protein
VIQVTKMVTTEADRSGNWDGERICDRGEYAINPAVPITVSYRAHHFSVHRTSHFNCLLHVRPSSARVCFAKTEDDDTGGDLCGTHTHCWPRADGTPETTATLRLTFCKHLFQPV